MRKKTFLYNIAAMVAMVAAAVACSPDEYDLGDKDVTSDDLKEGTAYTITQESGNDNHVTLTSKMAPRYQVTWVHPQGRSNDTQVDLKIPFPGTYEAQFGVVTRGGVVYGKPAQFTVSEFNATYVDGELWENLTGGVGSEKTWVPDNGMYGMGAGPLSYGDPSLDWGLNNFTPNWEPAGWSMMGNDQYGKSTLVFDLKNGAHVKSTVVGDDGAAGETTSGTFLIDTDNAKLNLTDVELMHHSAFNNVTDAIGWQKDIQIITLTKDRMQLGVVRNPATSGEGEWYLVFNFVSKDYADNYEAPENEVYPTLSDDWRDYVEPKTDKVVTYQLTGYDWYYKDGTAKGVTGVTPKASIENVRMVLDSGEGTYEFTDADEKTHTGKYSLSDDGVYTFSPALPEFDLSDDGRAVFRTGEGGTMRILGFDEAQNCNAQTGGLDNICWGSEESDDQGRFYQYQGYQWSVVRAGVKKTYKAVLSFFDTSWTFQYSDNVFVATDADGSYTFTINGSTGDAYGMFLDISKLLGEHPNCDVVITDIKVDGKSVDFDDTAIDRGAGDDAGTARRYILNPWGATAGDASKYVFSSSLAVTVSVKLDTGSPYITEE